MSKETRCGARPGAGRPATGQERGNFNTTLAAETLEYLQGVHPNAGRLIDSLVANHRSANSAKSGRPAACLESLTKELRLAEAQVRCKQAEIKAFGDFMLWGLGKAAAQHLLASLSREGVPPTRLNWFAGLAQKIEQARAEVDRAKAELPEGGFLKDPHYNRAETPSANLGGQIRWGTDDEHHDLGFWLDRWFGL